MDKIYIPWKIALSLVNKLFDFFKKNPYLFKKITEKLLQNKRITSVVFLYVSVIIFANILIYKLLKLQFIMTENSTYADLDQYFHSWTNKLFLLLMQSSYANIFFRFIDKYYFFLIVIFFLLTVAMLVYLKKSKFFTPITNPNEYITFRFILLLPVLIIYVVMILKFSFTDHQQSFSELTSLKSDLFANLIKIENSNDTRDVAVDIGKLLVLSVEEGYLKQKELQDFYRNNKIHGIFVSKTMLRNMTASKDVKFIKNLKEGSDLKVYADMYPITSYGDEYPIHGIPSQLALAATMSMKNIYDAANYYARELKETFFVDIVLEPTLDKKFSFVDTTLDTRTFGQNLDFIHQFAFAFINGINDAGLLTVIKHFPGHPQFENLNNNPEVKGSPYTVYSADTIKTNSMNFNSLLLSPLIDTAAILTDHVKIKGISEVVPYTIAVNNDSDGGVIKTRNLNLSHSLSPIIITDDISILTKQEIRASTKSHISSKKMRKLFKKNFRVNQVSDDEDRYSDSTICNDRGLKDKELNSLSKNVISALRAGHDIVLVRHLDISMAHELLKQLTDKLRNDTDLRRLVAKKIDRVDKYNKYVVDFKKSREDKQIPGASEEDINQIYKNSFTVLNMPDENLNKSNFQMLLDKKILFVSNYYERDDFFDVIKDRQNITYLPVKIVNQNESSISIYNKFKHDIIQKAGDLNNYDYIFIILSSGSANSVVKYIYKNVRDKKKMVLIFSTSPDVIYRNYQKNDELDDINPHELISSINAVAIYQNSRWAAQNFKRFFEFEKWNNISNLTIDLPDYYYFYSNPKKIQKNDFKLGLSISRDQVNIRNLLYISFVFGCFLIIHIVAIWIFGNFPEYLYNKLKR